MKKRFGFLKHFVLSLRIYKRNTSGQKQKQKLN